MSGVVLSVMEHRQGELRDVSFEILSLAYSLREEKGYESLCLLIESPEQGLEEGVKGWCDRVLLLKGKGFETFNQEIYQQVLLALIQRIRPNIVLLPHTPWGMDLAPALSVKSGFPLCTDCVSLRIENGLPKATRQIYGGKLFSEVTFRKADTYLVSIRPGSIGAEGPYGLNTTFEAVEGVTVPEKTKKVFKGFIDTGAGEIDISQAPFLISIGRGIGEQENIDQIKELAQKMGAVLSCSRPIVDKNWLPKYHQVGTSGKSVKPKVYLALGISGAFQHVAGIKGSGTIIAVNKDKKAPIFRVAQYGVVEDLFKVVSALKEKLGG